jgi:hypothetical protein
VGPLLVGIFRLGALLTFLLVFGLFSFSNFLDVILAEEFTALVKHDFVHNINNPTSENLSKNSLKKSNLEIVPSLELFRRSHISIRLIDFFLGLG